MSLAPRSVGIYVRVGVPRHDIHMGPERAHFDPGPTAPGFIDMETLERRLILRYGTAISAKVRVALSSIDLGVSLVNVGGVCHRLVASYEFGAEFPNTATHIVAWSCDANDGEDVHPVAVAENA